MNNHYSLDFLSYKTLSFFRDICSWIHEQIYVFFLIFKYVMLQQGTASCNFNSKYLFNLLKSSFLHIQGNPGYLDSLQFNFNSLPQVLLVGRSFEMKLVLRTFGSELDFFSTKKKLNSYSGSCSITDSASN